MTSSVIEGLGAYKQRKAEQDARREAASKPKVSRFSLEKDGDSAVVRFAQEIDHDAKNYDESVGIGFVNLEHVNPEDPSNGWKNRANHSVDSQGACFPCEKASDSTVEWADRKGWKPKERFYINVVGGEPREVVEKVNGKERTAYFTTDIDRKTGDGTVYVLEQSTFNGIWDQLAEVAVEDETITENYYKITRKGSGFNDTKYSLTRLKDEVPAKAKAVKDFELYDIKADILREVPYNQQQAFYYRGTSLADAADVVGSTSTGTKETW